MYRVELFELEQLQRGIMREVDTFQSLLTHRMTSGTTLTPSDLGPTDHLGSLGVILEVSLLSIDFVSFL